MTDIEGVDFAWPPHPTVAELHAAGKVFVSRYLSHDPSKDITLSELDSYKAGGIKVVLNWESTGTDTGFANGVLDARAAQAQAVALGEPDAVIYFSMDFDPTGRDAEIVAYAKGVASVLGHDRTGIYAGLAGISAYFDAAVGKYGWQTYAWSHGQWDPRAQVQQYSNGHTIGNASVDLDRAVNPDYGALGTPVSPPPAGPPILVVGDVGPDVKTLQSRLNTWGAQPPLVVDGVFGPLTEAAVKHFQGTHGLAVDGVVGPLTWAQLDKNPAPPPPPPPVFTPGQGVKHEGTGSVSLSRVAQLNNLSVLDVILETLHNATPEEAAAFANYCGSSFMQQGLVYYLPS